MRKEGDLLPIALVTQMHIRNDSQDNATFLVVKNTPNPDEMQAPDVALP